VAQIDAFFGRGASLEPDFGACNLLNFTGVFQAFGSLDGHGVTSVEPMTVDLHGTFADIDGRL